MSLGGPPMPLEDVLGRLLTTSRGLLADDHSRILLKPENSHSNSDYINASPIVSTRPSAQASGLSLGGEKVQLQEGLQCLPWVVTRDGLGQAHQLPRPEWTWCSGGRQARSREDAALEPTLGWLVPLAVTSPGHHFLGYWETEAQAPDCPYPRPRGPAAAGLSPGVVGSLGSSEHKAGACDGASQAAVAGREWRGLGLGRMAGGLGLRLLRGSPPTASGSGHCPPPCCPWLGLCRQQALAHGSRGQLRVSGGAGVRHS